jgi:hypothetical protein
VRFFVSFLIATLASASFTGLALYAVTARKGYSEPAPTDILLLGSAATDWSAVAAPGAGKCGKARRADDGSVHLTLGASTYALEPSTRTFSAAGPATSSGRYRPAAFEGYWASVSDTSSIELRNGSCELEVGPGLRTLPRLPVCPVPSSSLTAATVAPDGTAYALVYDPARRTHRLFTLALGGAAFVDRGVVPLVSAFAELRPAAGGRALIAGADGKLFAVDRTTVRQLPEVSPSRFGVQAAMADDGTVVVCGGLHEPKLVNLAFCACLPPLPLLLAAGLVVGIRRKLEPSAPGLVVGTILGILVVLCAGLLFILMAGGV